MLKFTATNKHEKGTIIHAFLSSVCVLHQFSRVPLFHTMDGSLPGSSVHGIFQVRILEWVAVSFSRDPPGPESEPASLSLVCAGGFFTR